MTEDEEFEFRHRLEQEQSLKSLTEAAAKPSALMGAAKSIVNPVANVAEKLHPRNLTGLLPTAGMAAGTALLPGVGTAAGAGLGSIAQRMADMVYKNDYTVPTTKIAGIPMAPKEAIFPMLNTAMAGVPETTQGIAAGNAIANKVGPILESAKQSFKKGFPKVAQVFTGKSAAKVGQLIKDPTAILPEGLGGAKSIEKASDAYGKALEEAPIHHPEGYMTRGGGLEKKNYGPFKKGHQEAEEVAQAMYEKWQAGGEISAQEAYNAKRATDKLWPAVVKERNAEDIRQMSEFKTAMDDILSDQSGHFHKASKDYARARLGADFTQIFPRTKTGDISTVKTLLLHTLAPGRNLGLLAGGLTAPLTTGVGNLAVQGGMKGLNAIVRNPQARQVLLQVLQKLRQKDQAVP